MVIKQLLNFNDVTGLIISKLTISFIMSARSSVRLHGTPRLPLDGF